MVRSTAKKVMWVGRATVFIVGLSVILALVLGVATTALGATGGSFILGKANNTASTSTGLISTLADAAKSALIVQNKSGGPALDLRVGNTSVPANNVAPMKVNSQKVVTNLNADKVDGQEANALLGKTEKAADSDKLDGNDSTAFWSGRTYDIYGNRSSGTANQWWVAVAWCDEGDVALSGGYWMSGGRDYSIDKIDTGSDWHRVSWFSGDTATTGQAIVHCADFGTPHQ